MRRAGLFNVGEKGMPICYIMNRYLVVLLGGGTLIVVQSIGISPVNLHAFMKTLESNISKAYKVQVAWKFHSLILMINMMWKRNWMTWLSSARQCKKNWKQHYIQNKSKFLPWYPINGLEFTVQNIWMSLNTLFELHMKSKM